MYDEIKEGSVFLSRTKDPISLFIRFGQKVLNRSKGKWSHTGVYLGGDKTIEAFTKGVDIGTLNNKKGVFLFGEPIFPDDNKKLFDMNMRNHQVLLIKLKEGVKYDFSYFAWGFRDDEKKNICSELSNDYLENIGALYIKKSEDRFITPDDIERVVMPYLLVEFKGKGEYKVLERL